MATLTLRNFPDDVYERLKERARRNHRSLTKEATAVLEEASHQLRDEEAILEEARRLAELGEPDEWLTEDLVNEAKNWGRP